VTPSEAEKNYRWGGTKMMRALALLLVVAAVTAHSALPFALRRRVAQSCTHVDLIALRGGSASTQEADDKPFVQPDPTAEEIENLPQDPEEPVVMVSFELDCHWTKPHESIGIVGSVPEMGSWKDVIVMR